MVTYGGMSRKPVAIPTGRLIFNDISIRGFWLSRWTQTHGNEERRAMIKELMVSREGTRVHERGDAQLAYLSFLLPPLTVMSLCALSVCVRSCCSSSSLCQELIREKEFRTFVQLKPFSEFQAALEEARQGYKQSKVVLTME